MSTLKACHRTRLIPQPASRNKPWCISSWKQLWCSTKNHLGKVKNFARS